MVKHFYGISGQEETLALEAWLEESDQDEIEREEQAARADEYFSREEAI